MLRFVLLLSIFLGFSACGDEKQKPAPKDSHCICDACTCDLSGECECETCHCSCSEDDVMPADEDNHDNGPGPCDDGTCSR